MSQRGEVAVSLQVESAKTLAAKKVVIRLCQGDGGSVSEQAASALSLDADVEMGLRQRGVGVLILQHEGSAHCLAVK